MKEIVDFQVKFQLQFGGKKDYFIQNLFIFSKNVWQAIMALFQSFRVSNDVSVWLSARKSWKYVAKISPILTG